MRAIGLLACVAMLAAGCKERRRAAASDDAGASALGAIDAALRRGGDFLAARQEADGAIRAPTYAAFRDGYALTGLAAMALTFAPGEAAARARPRAIEFLAGMVDARGELAPPAPAYPTYAAALAVLVLDGPGQEARRTTREALRAELRRRQLGPALGWRPEDASYGGWGYYPIEPRRPATDAIGDDLLSSNLSATLLVVGALALGGVPVDDPAMVLARGFVERCQNRDGGFFFSPAVPDANKAGAEGTAFRSYGSMTADGMRALVRLGVPLDDPRVRAAGDWLEANFDAEANPGSFPAVAEVRRASSYYYWAWTAAHALRARGTPVLQTARGRVAWAPALAAALLARQRPDGSWKNAATEMREDDPVVATSFAMAALTMCRSLIAGEHRSHAGWK